MISSIPQPFFIAPAKAGAPLFLAARRKEAGFPLSRE